MDILRVYLDNMFNSLPNNHKVRDAKEELYSMMEDKYNQLLKEGKTDNEAVGQVINEFGNLNELADTLGIRSEMDGQSDVRHIDTEEVTRIIGDYKKSAPAIGLGVLLIFIGVSFLISMLAMYELDVFALSEDTSSIIGVIGLLLLIGLAVYNFIIYGMKIDKYESLETNVVQLSYQDKEMIKDFKEELKFPKKIALSVLAYIVCSVPLILTAVITKEHDGYVLLSVVFMLLMIGIATYSLVKNGMLYSIYDQLLQEGDYTPEKKMAKKKSDKYISAFWMIVVAAYLGYSFITRDWARSWIIFPVAGVLTGVFTVLLEKN